MFRDFDTMFYPLIGLVAALGLTRNWRQAVMLYVIIDVVRDPVRKLSNSQSIMITLGAAMIWIAILLGVFSTEMRRFREVSRYYPELKTSWQFMVFALLPGALISITTYDSGYLMAIVGALSYLGPFCGLMIGLVYTRSIADLRRVLMLFCVVNALFLIGTYAEYQNWGWQGLGGLKGWDKGVFKPIEWVRYRPGQIIKLICGFYRSPDVMGLHAAHLVMFSMILMMENQKSLGPIWAAKTLWGLFCLVICGRRKMIGIPLAFMLSFLFLGRNRAARGIQNVAIITIIGGLLGFGFLVYNQVLPDVYTEFAGSMFSEGQERMEAHWVTDSYNTVDQNGLMGAGLGFATQGAHYTGVKRKLAWQEDGVSRAVAEFGIFGLMIALVSAWQMFLAVRRALTLGRDIVDKRVLMWQMSMFSVVSANFVCFLISHQAYSGDPAFMMFTAVCLGAVFSLPIPTEEELEQQHEQSLHDDFEPPDPNAVPLWAKV